MTAQQLFDLCVGIPGVESSNADSYVPTFLFQLNTVLAETYKLENNNRDYLGIAALTSIPLVTLLSDTLTYQDNILRNVVVWGVLTHLQLSDDEVVKTGFYNNKYADGQRIEMKIIPMDIVDEYGVQE
jgi:hypothetical protein